MEVTAKIIRYAGYFALFRDPDGKYFIAEAPDYTVLQAWKGGAAVHDTFIRDVSDEPLTYNYDGTVQIAVPDPEPELAVTKLRHFNCRADSRDYIEINSDGETLCVRQSGMGMRVFLTPDTTRELRDYLNSVLKEVPAK